MAQEIFPWTWTWQTAKFSVMMMSTCFIVNSPTVRVQVTLGRNSIIATDILFAVAIPRPVWRHKCLKSCLLCCQVGTSSADRRVCVCVRAHVCGLSILSCNKLSENVANLNILKCKTSDEKTREQEKTVPQLCQARCESGWCCTTRHGQGLQHIAITRGSRKSKQHETKFVLQEDDGNWTTSSL